MRRQVSSRPGGPVTTWDEPALFSRAGATFEQCDEHHQRAVGELRTARGGQLRGVRVCRTPNCGAYYASAWAPSLPALWCSRVGGDIDCPYDDEDQDPEYDGPRLVCSGCTPNPGYDYLDPGGIFVALYELP